MREVLFSIGGRDVSVLEAGFGLAVLALLLLLVILVTARRASRERMTEAAAALERGRELDDKLAELNRIQSEMTGRMQTMAEIFGTRQGDMVRHLAERLDGLQHRVGQGLESTREKTAENLAQLGERLAVIDAAQKNLSELTREVVGLKDVLANKQARGAYGQARMEAIVRDGLPGKLYAFQPTLANGRRPDCCIYLPNDPRPMVVDSKFPLEAFTALKDARDDAGRMAAAQRVRTDVGLHVKDIAEKYLTGGLTQDVALMFVPSEAIYAELVEGFDDLIQRAHRQRVVLVSPSLMMMAIQILQALYRDHRMQEEARVIQAEVRKLVEDVVRLGDRVAKLDAHFRQAQEDVAQIRVSAEKVTRRGARIDQLDFRDEAQGALPGLGGAAKRAAE
jgi:DNA recombination protein RmuC